MLIGIILQAALRNWLKPWGNNQIEDGYLIYYKLEKKTFKVVHQKVYLRSVYKDWHFFKTVGKGKI